MLVADAVPHMANYAVFKYPVALVIGLIAAIFVICLSVPAIVHKATSDETDHLKVLHNFEKIKMRLRGTDDSVAASVPDNFAY